MKKLGLALSSGGARGLVHIGVIKSLNEHGIKIDFITGTSAGAFIGGLYSINGDIDTVIEMAENLSYRKFLKHMRDLSIRSGMIKGDLIEEFIQDQVGFKKIEDCKIPFRAVTTDIGNGNMVVLKDGSLAEAIRASISIPFVFKPVKINGKFLVDGALVCPLPVNEVKSMGAEKVLAVSLYHYDSIVSSNDKELSKTNPLRVGRLSLQVMLSSLALETARDADMVLIPEVPKVSWKDIKKADDYIKIGEKLVKKNIREIEKMIE